MTVPLDILRERVERHFKLLACKRENSGFPVFAMEHGLSKEDLDQLRLALRAHRKLHPLRSSDWLLWVIYATEVGYSYTGEEYWKSFEGQTPCWEFQDRNRIKTWFRKFQRDLNGVVPSGPWAEHFTIIAWPITHAILPLYLQRQFARALYALRYRLAGMATCEPKMIGQLLAVNVHMPSTRFREFLQQEELIGRIVLALFGEEASPSSQSIYPQTLQRIVADLDRVRNSREWLKETRRIVSDRFKGIGRGHWPPEDRSPYSPTTPPAIDDTKQFAIRPKMLLRHTGRGNWSVLLEVPSFRNLCALDANFHSFLKTTRCRLNGGNDMKPRGWLLSENRKGILHSWPDAARPLIQLEQPHPIIDRLLEAECRLPSKPVWLFRIGTDGTARQITSGTVRPDCDYILITTARPPQANEFMSSCALDCLGATAFRLAIPVHVSAELHSWIGDLGLHVARTIRVWPAGLPGRGWDGEGSSEWLTTEAPCFGISHDHPVDAYAFRLNGGPEHLVQTDGTAKPLFVRLPPLPVGIHSLKVKACRSRALETVISSSPAEGFIQLTVREPEPWTPGVASHPGLIVTIDPADPDLDTFWRNETCLYVRGPANYAASLTVELKSADGDQILEEQVGTFDLPITPDNWRQSFEQFLKHEKRAESYLEATKGTLIIDGETLGNCSIMLEHDVKPVRWLTRRTRNDIIIRLVDDAGHEGTEAKVYCYDMGRPLEMSLLAPDKARAGLVVKPPGSLFYAVHAEHNDTLAVANVSADKGLQGLGLSPKVGEVTRNARALLKVLHVLTKWQEARLSGFLVKFRHRQIVEGILEVLYESLCGRNWAEAETRFRNNPKSPEALEILKSRVDRKTTGFAAALIRNRSEIESDPAQRTARFADVAAHYKVCNDRKLCEFALRLASQHQIISGLPRTDTDLDTLISPLLNYPATLRGARLLALLAASDEDGAPLPLLPRWQW